MDKNDKFESERLSFRGINESDTDCLVKWRSNPELIQFFRNPNPIKKESHLNWYNSYYLLDNFRFDFIITEKVSGTAIGYVGVCDIDISAKSCEVYYMIGEPEFQRMGFASEAILTIIGYAQKQGILHFVAEVHKDNLASIRTVRKLGFVATQTIGDFVDFKYIEA